MPGLDEVEVEVGMEYQQGRVDEREQLRWIFDGRPTTECAIEMLVMETPWGLERIQKRCEMSGR